MVAARQVRPDRLRHAVLQEQAGVVAEHGVPDGRLDAHAGGASRYDEVFDPERLENRVQVGLIEAAKAVLGDDNVAGGGASSSRISVFQVSRISVRLAGPSERLPRLRSRIVDAEAC